MANQPGKPQNLPPGCIYDGPALAVPPEQRVLPKKHARFDDLVIPRSYYVTAGLAVAAGVLGLLAGRFLLP
jgi:hypothetical protein